jgi:hypothetical protein
VIPGEMCGRQLRERDPEEEDGPGAWGRAVSEGAGGGRGAPTSGVPASVREGGGTATRPWRGGAGTGRARSAGPWRFAGWGDLGAGRAGLRGMGQAERAAAWPRWAAAGQAGEVRVWAGRESEVGCGLGFGFGLGSFGFWASSRVWAPFLFSFLFSISTTNKV